MRGIRMHPHPTGVLARVRTMPAPVRRGLRKLATAVAQARSGLAGLDARGGFLGQLAGRVGVGRVHQRHAHAALDEALGLAEQADVAAGTCSASATPSKAMPVASTPP
jgi:hypothetical protein